MKRMVLAAIVCVVGPPATAWGLTTYPAAPRTISLTRTGHPRCTTLKYVLDKPAPRSVLSVHRRSLRVYRAVRVAVPPGARSFRWCGEKIGGGHVSWCHFSWRIKRESPRGHILSRSQPQPVYVVP